MHKFFAKTDYLGKTAVNLPQCHSTNDLAHQMVKNGSAKEGTIIIAQDQTKGRGQRGNSWISEPHKNATFSIILEPVFVRPQQQFHLHVITTLAIFDALSTQLDDRLKIKWPNDIYYGNQKLGGILIENSLSGAQISSSIIGIGLNVNQVSFGSLSATSLRLLTGRDHDIHAIIEDILVNLESQYSRLKQNDSSELISRYQCLLYRKDIPAQFIADGEKFTGVIKGINESGQLCIDENGILRTFNFKEIEFLFSSH